MTKDEFLTILKTENIPVEEITISRNNVNKNAYVLGPGTIRPTIYEDYLENFNTKEDVLFAYQNSLNFPGTFTDLDKMFSWDNIKEHVYLCLQQKTEEDLIKKTFLDFEIYVRYFYNNDYSIKISSSLLPYLGIDEKLLFETAWNNIKPHIFSKKMSSIFGISDPLDLYVISTNLTQYGAIAILDYDTLDQVCKECHISKLVLIPSSIHEFLVYPYFTNDDLQNINEMIQEINETIVVDEEILGTRYYIYDSKSHTIL